MCNYFFFADEHNAKYFGDLKILHYTNTSTCFTKYDVPHSKFSFISLE